jgi:hypothetical protein
VLLTFINCCHHRVALHNLIITYDTTRFIVVGGREIERPTRKINFCGYKVRKTMMFLCEGTLRELAHSLGTTV